MMWGWTVRFLFPESFLHVLVMTSSRRGLASRVIMRLRFQTIAGNYTLGRHFFCCCCVLSETRVHSFTLLLLLLLTAAVPALQASVCVFRGGVKALRGLLFATVAPAALTLNIQQLSSTAPERSSNYRSSQPDSLYLHLPVRRWGWTLGVLYICVCGREVLMRISGREREKLKLSICVPICLPLHVSLKNIMFKFFHIYRQTHLLVMKNQSRFVVIFSSSSDWACTH